jgi:hypothetical protein
MSYRNAFGLAIGFNLVMLILDEDYEIKSAFIPVVGDRKLTMTYFQAISVRYFNVQSPPRNP